MSTYFEITGSVGKGGDNNPWDVPRIQSVLFVLTANKLLTVKKPILLTSICDSNTIDGILIFQASFGTKFPPDGLIKPNDATFHMMNFLLESTRKKSTLETTLREVLSSGLKIFESDWSFVTSAGSALTVSTPIAKIGISAGGGALWVKNDSQQSPIRLEYGGIGGSAGLSLVPTPVNFSFSLPKMPSTGKIYKLPFAGFSLSLNEMKGGFLMFEIAGDFGPGLSGSAMFIGGNVAIATAVGMASPGGALHIPALITTSKACVAFGGLTASLIPANVSVSIFAGGIL